MISVVHRLVLTGGVILQSGAVWPDASDEKFIVGPIFFVPEATVRTSSGEDESEDSETNPAHYEVWQVPAEFLAAMYSLDFTTCAKALDQITELMCFRVWLSGNVQICEERWPTVLAMQIVQDRLLDAFEAAGINVNSSGDAPANGDAHESPPPQPQVAG